eukprot:361720-Chlamydomonas_euryale.AAC.6
MAMTVGHCFHVDESASLQWVREHDADTKRSLSTRITLASCLLFCRTRTSTQVLQWAREHDADAKRIAAEAQKLALKFLNKWVEHRTQQDPAHQFVDFGLLLLLLLFFYSALFTPSAGHARVCVLYVV